MTPKLAVLAGTWGRPPDLPAKIAASVAIALLLLAVFGGGRTWLGALGPASRGRRRFLAGTALVASLLSLAYVAIYLRGGPRIVDATTYFLQGRVLARGDFAWPAPDPTASFRGRFLLFHDDPDHATLGGIFPPGYPLLLSFGFMLGAPMIVGPLLAAGIALMTHRLVHALGGGEPAARAAALLSLLCAALRYHTADTMSHGAAALGVTVAFTAALEARRDTAPDRRRRWSAFVLGLALGYVFATRPVSMLPAGIVATLLLRKTPRLLGWTAGGMLPGLLLLLLAQHEVTGSWLTSTQRLYYTISDGPPGCFRWGFGKGVGCIFEHGDFVEARLPHGYGLVEAAQTSLRRLHHHLLDVANFEPLALLVLVPVLRRRTPEVRAATAVVALQILAYAPFYFDGDYPGGGARFFADVLPIEHALVMLGVAELAGAHVVRGAQTVLALAAGGFAVHASFEHDKLRDRDGGRPMFEHDPFIAQNITHGLVFVDTDHGFSLGYDPAAQADRDLVVARLRSDDRDRMLFDALGHPPTYLYRFDTTAAHADGANAPHLTPWTPAASSGMYRFEAEAEWPPLWQEGGFAAPIWAGGCSSGARVLSVTPTAPTSRAPARATITVPVPSAGRWSVEVHIVNGASVPHLHLPKPAGVVPAEGAFVIGNQRWTWKPGSSCMTLTPKDLELAPPYTLATIEATGATVSVDYVTLRKL